MASNNQGEESVVPHSQQQQLVRAILYPRGRMLHAQRKEQQFFLDLMDEFESQVPLGNYVCNLTTVRNHILSRIPGGVWAYDRSTKEIRQLEPEEAEKRMLTVCDFVSTSIRCVPAHAKNFPCS